MRVLITGAGGFIGSNLRAQLEVRGGYQIIPLGRDWTPEALAQRVAQADFICHLAGVNRPDDVAEFALVNTDLTRELCEAVRSTGRRTPIMLASSAHAGRDNLDPESKLGSYAASKRAAEELLRRHADETGAPVHIFRLPHVIGKWCRPNYNSVVATFCHNIARDLPIAVDDPDYTLTLVYIDDLVDALVRLMEGRGAGSGPFRDVTPSYQITVGELAARLRAYRASRETLMSERVGAGLDRALYATYVSYLPVQDFTCGLKVHRDARGTFAEMVKTPDAGQVSFFTAHPGVTRGGHYHHSKSEKFLVVKGSARFRFRHILTQQTHEVSTSGARPEIVETVPGWAHDITNVGDDELVVMLWANEILDPDRPDTYASPLT